MAENGVANDDATRDVERALFALVDAPPLNEKSLGLLRPEMRIEAEEEEMARSVMAADGDEIRPL